MSWVCDGSSALPAGTDGIVQVTVLPGAPETLPAALRAPVIDVPRGAVRVTVTSSTALSAGLRTKMRET